jgi:hypothetical protein
MMEHINVAITWLKTNWDSVLTLWACLIGAAEVIVKWCDSARAIAVVDKIRSVAVKLISWLTKFGFESKKAK